MDTDCLNDDEFLLWQQYWFHCKIWNNNEILKHSYQGYDDDREQIKNKIKDDYPDCRIISIRKGKLTHPELHQRVLEYNK